METTSPKSKLDPRLAQRLPNSSVIEQQLAKLRENFPDPPLLGQHVKKIEYLVWRLARCKERDDLLADMPEGCRCFGAGIIYADHGTPDAYCDCPKGKDSKTSDLVATRLMRRSIVQARWLRTGIPVGAQDWRFETSSLGEKYGEVISRMKVDDKASWFLWGDYGRGKTGLAVSWLWARLEEASEDDSLVFTTVPDLLTALRATYSASSAESELDIIQRFGRASTLVLDDLGAEQLGNQEWLSDRLYQIIGHRHANQLPTVFTSNLDLDQVASRIGQRITWRIYEMCGRENIVHVVGPNLRL